MFFLSSRNFLTIKKKYRQVIQNDDVLGVELEKFNCNSSAKTVLYGNFILLEQVCPNRKICLI